MKRAANRPEQKTEQNGRSAIRLWAVLFWLFVWEAASLAVGSQILLVSPLQAAQRLLELLPQPEFWSAVFFSFCRISGGFFLAAAAGILLAMLAARFARVEELLTPLMLAVKTIPVASFIILALIWFSSRSLSVFISFLMVLPVVYTNVSGGIRSLDRSLLEMAELFRIPCLRRIRYIDLPQVLPYFQTACGISLGLCWKSGVAAEVIGMPDGSIGERLQQAKVYLDTPDLFAWTFVIVAISLGFEKLVLFLLRRCAAALQTDTLTGGKAVLNSTQRDAQPLICVKNLCKTYHGKEVLNHLNLRIQKGRTTALMAPSGWGKTTFLRILAGLEEPDAGEITGLEGSRFSAVFQEDRLCPGLSAPLNIRLVNPGHSAAEVLGRMKALGLSDCAEQPVCEFSGGMKRRTAILRALLAEYDVLFLDEPFKGLDLETRAQVLRVFREMTVEKTILFVTHEPEEAQALGAEIIRLPEAAHPAGTQKM